MPRYRVDVLVEDSFYGVISQVGTVNVDAKNINDARQQGYDWFYSDDWEDQDINVLAQRIPKVKGERAGNVEPLS